MRGCLFGLGVLIVVAVAVVVAAWWLLQRGPALTAGLTPVAVSSAAAGQFDRKIATVSNARGPVTVTIDDAEATSKLAVALAADPNAPAIDNPQVAFRDGKVYISGVTRDTPIPIKVAVVGRVEARNGQLVTTVDQVDTGGVPLPSSLRDRIVAAVTDTSAINAALPIKVDEVQVLDGRLVLTGQAK